VPNKHAREVVSAVAQKFAGNRKVYRGVNQCDHGCGSAPDHSTDEAEATTAINVIAPGLGTLMMYSSTTSIAATVAEVVKTPTASPHCACIAKPFPCHGA
jgi:hypothetical protein